MITATQAPRNEAQHSGAGSPHDEIDASHLSGRFGLWCANRDKVASVREILFVSGPAQLVGVAESYERALELVRRPLDAWLQDADLPLRDEQALLERAGSLSQPVAIPVLASIGVVLRVFAGPAAEHACRRLARLAPRTESSLRGAPAAAANDRLVVRSAGRLHVFRAHEIVWIEAVHNSVLIHTARGKTRYRKGIAAVAGMLDARRFMRIHRSAIINLDAVCEIVAIASGRQAVTMSDGSLVAVGRLQQGRLLEALRGAPTAAR